MGRNQKAISHTRAEKIIKHVGKNLAQESRDLYNENHKTRVKGMEEGAEGAAEWRSAYVSGLRPSSAPPKRKEKLEEAHTHTCAHTEKDIPCA